MSLRTPAGVPQAALGHRTVAILCTALVLVLTACESGRTAGEQVIATVGDSEISVEQLNDQLARLGIQRSSVDEKVKRRALEALVDQRILAEQALDDGLDRDPRVLEVLEHARRQVLSEAYLERNLVVPRPTPEEVKGFYAANPALFEKRRIYTFQDFTIERSLLSDALRAKLAAARTRDDLVTTLRAANIGFHEAGSLHAAEQLPLEILPNVFAMAKGDTFPLVNHTTVVLMHLVDFTEHPIGLEQATAYIEQFLINAKRKQLAELKLQELRAKTKIAYPGGTEGIAEGPGWAQPASAAKPAPPR